MDCKVILSPRAIQLMRMHYSLPRFKTLRVFGGVGRRGSGMESENP